MVNLVNEIKSKDHQSKAKLNDTRKFRVLIEQDHVNSANNSKFNCKEANLKLNNLANKLS